MLFGDSPTPGLVGIAKLAARSEVLDTKRVVRYFEMESRSVLNRTGPGTPFEWSLNPYRGCEFGCRYCYARYTHEFMELRDSVDFEDKIYAKSDIGQLLQSDLKRVGTGQAIAIGTATDPYQPAERRYKRTQTALEVFARSTLARNKNLTLSITTKSNLVTRDIPLLQEIATQHAVNVNMTVTTLDTGLARILEPRAPSPELRLKAVQAIASAGIPVGVFPSPIMPLITDQKERLERLANAAKEHGATYFGGGVLFLMPCSRKVFFPFVEKHFPHLLRRYRERYEKDAYLRGPYRDAIRERVAAVREKYGLKSGPPPREVAVTDHPQARLFEHPA